MFTGLIEEISSLENVKKTGSDIYCLSVKTACKNTDIKTGNSLAVNGVCLTVTGINNSLVSFDVMGITFKNTNLSLLKKGCLLNIEKAVLAGSRLGGHFVQGHVDGMTTLKHIGKSKDGMEFVLSLDKKDRTLIADKGSVALDGISLTVQMVTAQTFSVFIIPHTFKNTNLKEKKIGDKLNLEFDILAKYAARRNNPSTINHSFLAKNGF